MDTNETKPKIFHCVLLRDLGMGANETSSQALKKILQEIEAIELWLAELDPQSYYLYRWNDKDEERVMRATYYCEVKDNESPFYDDSLEGYTRFVNDWERNKQKLRLVLQIPYGLPETMLVKEDVVKK